MAGVERLPRWWIDVSVGCPCLVAAVASRVVFPDGDTWPHIGLRVTAIVLLVGYSAAATTILMREV